MLRKPIYGVGINDADYTAIVNLRIDGKLTRIWACPYYSRWFDMLTRCYNRRQRKSYIGCTVCDEWLIFSNFKSWMENQDWEGKHLDKDILCNETKIYSPETCAFVPYQLNAFLLDSAASRGDYKIGCSFSKAAGKFTSACGNPFLGKREHLGVFNTEDEAHQAWKKRKHELACQLADMQDDPRIANALRQKFK